MAAIRWTKDSILGFVNSHIVDYPTPVNLNYFWSFGSTAGICLVIQILTGVFLAMHYTPHVDFAFVRHEVSPFISVRSGISCVMLIFYLDMRLEQSKGMKLKGQCSHIFKRFEVKELE